MKSKLSLLLVLLLVLSVFAFADTHDDVNDEHDEADEYDDEKDKDFDDEKDDDDDSDKGIELTLSESDAIAKALAELSEYANLTVDDISIEDNGYEIEFVSAIYEIEVFVDADGQVTIEKVDEEDIEVDDENTQLNLSKDEAINLALAQLSEYENLSVDDISIEDNGYEIEFVSAIYEIEVFVDANRVVNIEKIEEEDEKKDEEESYDEDDSDVYTKNPSVLIMDAITQIQQLVEGNIIEIKLKSSDDNLYWDARTNLNLTMKNQK